MEPAVGGSWTRVRTLGRGASGAVVSLAADDLSGALFAVKSAPAAAAAAEQLRREGDILSGLCSPHVLPCLGFRAGAAGECQLFLEFAPGGSVADVAERRGGRLEECAVRAYAADVARGLAYLHGRSLVHGDVKGRNVVVGADGRAKIADFGCARAVGSDRPVGGTPAFMAPEVARGEEQGPAADVWALGCTVVEMATGRAPWSDMGDVLAAMHRIGYTDAVPEVPAWLSAEAKHFLSMCFARNARDRCTAAQLLEHPFLASAGCGVKPEEAAAKWVSPKSTLDAALWESDTEDDDDDVSESPAERIRALASPSSAFPDWDSDEGWIDVLHESGEACDAAAAAEDEPASSGEEASETEVEFSGSAYVEDADRVCTVGLAAPSAEQQKEFSSGLFGDPIVLPVSSSLDESEITESLLHPIVITVHVNSLLISAELISVARWFQNVALEICMNHWRSLGRLAWSRSSIYILSSHLMGPCQKGLLDHGGEGHSPVDTLGSFILSWLVQLSVSFQLGMQCSAAKRRPDKLIDEHPD